MEPVNLIVPESENFPVSRFGAAPTEAFLRGEEFNSCRSLRGLHRPESTQTEPGVGTNPAPASVRERVTAERRCSCLPVLPRAPAASAPTHGAAHGSLSAGGALPRLRPHRARPPRHGVTYLRERKAAVAVRKHKPDTVFYVHPWFAAPQLPAAHTPRVRGPSGVPASPQAAAALRHPSRGHQGGRGQTLTGCPRFPLPVETSPAETAGLARRACCAPPEEQCGTCM